MACHEVPSHIPNDERIKIIPVDFASPFIGGNYHSDKHEKLKTGLSYYYGNPTSMYMILDADDVVHRELVKFVIKRSPKNYLVRHGYVYNGGKFLRAHRGNFDQLCGSVCISTHKDFMEGRIPLFEGHQNIRHSKTIEEDFEAIPFYAVVKCVGYGQNWTRTDFFWAKTFRRTVRNALMMRPITNKIRQQFSI